MRTVYAIAPWEYPGADFDPNPHAFTRHIFAGKERELWLKMRDSVIYFGEGRKPAAFAVPQLFDMTLSQDAERLTAIWEEHVERENYGALLTRHQRWPHTFATGQFILILRPNGSGWVTEFSAKDWQEFPSPAPTNLPLWDGNNFRARTSLIVRETKSHFLNRAVNPEHFQTVPPHWAGGGKDKMISVIRSAAQLLLEPKTLKFFSGRPLQWKCSSHSAFAQGHIEDIFSNYGYGDRGLFGYVRFLARYQFGFIGVKWKRANEDTNLEKMFEEKQWKKWASADEWGENWRGNFVGSQYKMTLTAPPFSMPSHHDKLESAVILKEFLADKLPADQIEAMLREALQN